MRGSAFLLMLLAGCSGGNGSAPDEACERQANSDPAVTEILRKGAGNLDYEWKNSEQLQAARKQAALRCLRARGMAPKGGVELPRAR